MMTPHQEQVTRAYEGARDDVYRYLLMLGIPPPQAEETAQEVFVRMYLALENGDAIQSERAWIFRVARNLAIDQRRRKQPAPLDPELERRLHDTARGIESDLIERERMEELALAWSGLSPKQRECLHLRAEGLRYREIAESMGISISTVREFLSRAITKLKRAVHE